MLSAWEKVPVREIESLQAATEEPTKRFGGSAVAGLVGGALPGGAGLVAGAMAVRQQEHRYARTAAMRTDKASWASATLGRS